MAGRQRPPNHIEDPRLLLRPPALLEERIAANHREIQGLLIDNQRLAGAHLALKQDLSLADQELRQLAATARNVREDRESKVKELFERSLKLEAEVRVSGIHALKEELSQVRNDVQRLTESKIELNAQFKDIESQLSKAKLEAVDVPAIRADFDNMRQELHKGRAAIEFEKKTQAANMEQSRAMEKNMVSIQREIDRLLAELANAEKRARAAAAAAANPNPGYMGNYGSTGTNLAYGAAAYPQYPMHQESSS